MKIYPNTNQTDQASHLEIASPLSLLSSESWIFVKENLDRKKANSALQQLRTEFRSMMGEERLNTLSLVCVHRDIFLDHDKIIDIYASKYPKRMLLINLLSKNWTIGTFSARKTNKAYINSTFLVYILSL